MHNGTKELPAALFDPRSVTVLKLPKATTPSANAGRLQSDDLKQPKPPETDHQFAAGMKLEWC